jgi:alpha-tubulin suppressor-like RCC1 family protein
MRLLLAFLFLISIITFENCAERDIDKSTMINSNGDPVFPDEVKSSAKIQASQGNACLLNNGNLKCWGDNSFGQLGIGSYPLNAPFGVYVPQQVLGMDSGVSFAALGFHAACAIRSGKLYCWGRNDGGQLGLGTQSFATVIPAPVSTMDSGVTYAAIGNNTLCAIKNGGLFCWGYNDTGAIGDDTLEPRLSPAAVKNMSSDVTQVAISENYETFSATFTCAIKSGGLYCWGHNNLGQLGNGNLTSTKIAGPVANMGSGVTQVVSGISHACAIKQGRLYCWGGNGSGQLGTGDNANKSTPTLVSGPLQNLQVSMVAAGGYATCAVAEGKLYCWGANYRGQLGVGDTTNKNIPVLLSSVVNDAVSIDVSNGNAYAVVGKKLFGWGTYNQQLYTTPMSLFDIP